MFPLRRTDRLSHPAVQVLHEVVPEQGIQRFGFRSQSVPKQDAEQVGRARVPLGDHRDTGARGHLKCPA